MTEVENEFKPAVRHKAKLRMALWGPSGSGKSYTALTIASALGPKVALVDTEHQSHDKYADVFRFDVSTPENNDPRTFARKIWNAASAGYDSIILDTITPAWSGVGGATDLNDRIAAAKYGGNGWRAWAETNVIVDELLRAILEAPIHVIATMRAKQIYAVEEDGKKTSIRKLGTGPEQRNSIEYEFDIIGQMDAATIAITKTRMPDLEGIVVERPGPEFVAPILSWLDGGEPPELEKPATTKAIADLVRMLEAEGRSKKQINDVFSSIRSRHHGVLPAEWIAGRIEAARERAALAVKETGGPDPQPEPSEPVSEAPVAPEAT